jgi:hypothetical protein
MRRLGRNNLGAALALTASFRPSTLAAPPAFGNTQG